MEEKNNEEFNNFERAYSRKINVKKIIVFISLVIYYKLADKSLYQVLTELTFLYSNI